MCQVRISKNEGLKAILKHFLTFEVFFIKKAPKESEKIQFNSDKFAFITLCKILTFTKDNNQNHFSKRLLKAFEKS